MVKARGLAQDLAVQYYTSQAPGDTPNTSLREYVPEALASGIIESLKAKHQDKVLTRDALGTIVGVTTRHAEQAGRNKTISLTIADPEAKGWIRYDPKPPTCHFCLTMIARSAPGIANTGIFYRSEASAGGLNDWHDLCTCKVAPVFDTRNFDGLEQAIKADKIYRAAIEEFGPGLLAVRRYLTEHPGEQLPDPQSGLRIAA